MSNAKILLIEPFYTGSHKTLMVSLMKYLPADDTLIYTMKGIKWPWRARCSSLYFSQTLPLPLPSTLTTLFASCVLNLTELIALRPDLNHLKKIIYFHENQLIYPKQKNQERDFQFGYNQVLSCLVADIVVFNSEFNLRSFVSSLRKFFKLMPDNRPKNLETLIENKAIVIYFPIEFPLYNESRRSIGDHCMRILWPHRWEHDKDPETFFNVMFKLKEKGINFKLSVLGQNYAETPEIFDKAKKILNNQIENWGFLECREDYWNILFSSNIVISTAKHEFFGVAMIEAAFAGCFPLCPKELVYPEIFPDECLYKNEEELVSKLVYHSDHTVSEVNIDFKRYDVQLLIAKYKEILY